MEGKDIAKTGGWATFKVLGGFVSAIIIIVILSVTLVIGVLMGKKDQDEKEEQASSSSDGYTVNGGVVKNPRSNYAENEVPEEFKKLYKTIAKKYGIDWQLLAGIHRVETAFSSNVQESSAGAIGHTQFMKCTWAGWSAEGCSGSLGNAEIPKSEYTDPSKIKSGGGEGVDGNGNGKADPMEIADALSATAKKLKKDGASESPEKAVHSYNHSSEYVSDVMGHYKAYKSNVKWVKAGIKDPDKLGEKSSSGDDSSGGSDIGNFKGDLPKPDKKKFNLQPTYPYGQCTWYVHQRRHQIGKDVPTTLGNGGDWGDNAKSQGFKVGSKAKVGSAASIPPGSFGAPAPYGHVAFVEKVKKDGGIVVSESNVKGEGVISYREFSKADTQKMKFIYDK